MIYHPPGVEEIELNTIVLDLNGTLTVRGKIPTGVKQQIVKLKKLGFKVILLSGDQRGTAAGIAKKLGIELQRAGSLEEKANCMSAFSSETTVAIGNARIDIGTFKHAKVRIATLQAEGIHAEILKHVDIVVPSIADALDLLLDENSFNATMRM